MTVNFPNWRYSNTRKEVEVLREVLNSAALKVKFEASVMQCGGFHCVGPEFQENGFWCLLHNNAQTDSLVIVSGCLMKRGITVLSHPPCSPDLALVDFLIS